MSLATHPKLPERPGSKGRGAALSLDKPTLGSSRETPRGRERPIFGDRGRGRGAKRNTHDVPSNPPIRLATTLLKDHLPPKPSTRPVTPKVSASTKSPLPSPNPAQTATLTPPSTTPHRARSRSPQPKDAQESNRTPPPPAKQSPSNSAHRRGRGRRLKNKEPAPLKPLSLEDAFASLKCNPFDGGPLKTPLVLTPLPQTQSAPKLAPPSPDEPKKVESRDDSEAQYLTVPVPVTPGPSTSRPITPLQHFDWAEEDDDDSLPDLDDWVTSSTKIVVPSDGEKDAPPVVEVVPTSEIPQEETSEKETSIESTNDSDIKLASLANDRTTIEPADPVEDIKEGHAEQTSEMEKLPARHPETARPDELSAVSTESVPTESLIPTEPRAMREESWRSKPLHKRPNSVASPHVPGNRNAYAAQFDRLHSRALSLPQANRGSANTRTRPVISAAGLTRLSRTLAQGGLSPSPTKVSGPAIAD